MLRPVSMSFARSRSRALGARGFTLVELTIVSAIVVVLSTVGVVAYRRYVHAAHTSEAIRMVQQIRLAQERFKADTDNLNYANVSKGLGTKYDTSNLYPTTTPSNTKVGWGATCSNCNPGIDWRALNIDSDGPVRFGYSTISGGPWSMPPMVNVDLRDGTQPLWLGWSWQSWYMVSAVGDATGSGTLCMVIGHSFSNALVIENVCE